MATDQTGPSESLDTIGALDPVAVQRVREEAWPQPESAEEVHDALLWMGYGKPSSGQFAGEVQTAG